MDRFDVDVEITPLLLWWADSVALLSLLPRRARAQALSGAAEYVRHCLATKPDKAVIPQWQINRLFGFEVFPEPEREWHNLPDEPGPPELAWRIVGGPSAEGKQTSALF